MGGTKTHFTEDKTETREMNQFMECEMSTSLALNPGFLIPIHLGTYYIPRFMGDTGALPSWRLQSGQR